MTGVQRFLAHWVLAILIMMVIFLFSATSSSELPDFDWADMLVKKSGHALGFGLLAISYWRGLAFKKHKLWMAWLLAVAYAVSDEFHQTFTPGRSATAVDVMIDSLGASLALLYLNVKLRESKN
jgi:VanZ family protein